jgi:hypothetical protein
LAWLEEKLSAAIHPIRTAAKQMAIDVLVRTRLDDQAYPAAVVMDHLFKDAAPPIADG